MMAAFVEQDDMTLADLLPDVAVDASVAAMPVSGLNLDSRRVAAGGLFIACQGYRTHGLNFVEQAIQNGAVAVLCETGEAWDGARVAALAERLTVPLVEIPGLRSRVSEIAARFYGDPSQHMTVFGVTGTNGKTSITHFLAQALAPDCAVVGTLGAGFPGQLDETGHTTPDTVTLQAELARLKVAGAHAVAIEVSSHALDQGRANAVRFEAAVFTNLSRDHLDYHGDMDSYAQAKQRMFRMHGLNAAVLNHDDAFGRQIAADPQLQAPITFYGRKPEHTIDADHWVWAEEMRVHPAGFEADIDSSWGKGVLRSGLLGGFNLSNLLAVFAVLLQQGVSLAEALDRLAGLQTVPGRMEVFRAAGKPQVVVDYAHTPDALEQVLVSLRPHVEGRLICVFGCGGERDAGKRPMMGAIAEQFSDRVIVTDDNPRRENGDAIVQAILDGIKVQAAVQVERNRGRAIAAAIDEANESDVVLVAGKGHETTQQIGDLKIAFSDRETVADLLGVRGL